MNLRADLVALSTPRFPCGHEKATANIYVVLIDGRFQMRCRECHRQQARDWHERKRQK